MFHKDRHKRPWRAQIRSCARTARAAAKQSKFPKSVPYQNGPYMRSHKDCMMIAKLGVFVLRECPASATQPLFASAMLRGGKVHPRSSARTRLAGLGGLGVSASRSLRRFSLAHAYRPPIRFQDACMTWSLQFPQRTSLMLRRTNMVWLVLIAVLVAAGVMPGAAVAQSASVPKPQDRLALGESEVKQLLLLMDTGRNGKISKQEYMKFMESEFDRLDKKNNGELDVRELTQSKLRVSHFAALGK